MLRLRLGAALAGLGGSATDLAVSTWVVPTDLAEAVSADPRVLADPRSGWSCGADAVTTSIFTVGTGTEPCFVSNVERAEHGCITSMPRSGASGWAGVSLA
mmetsp:Transcript_8852/g.27458  ORF Transcript_8852/g.27458 Transcript_8852/m.27458 type:complete len:101 (+) Transcript_8852:407-709(+)